MRINELKIPNNIKQIENILNKYGYKKLGHDSGFGYIYYKNNSNYVLKIFKNTDLAYIAYINLVKKHNNIHFPKFYSNIVKLNSDHSAIKIELLSNFNDDYKTIKTYMLYRDEDLGIYSEDRKKMVSLSIDYMNKNPTLKTACDLIIDNLLLDFNLDINSHNLMRRNDTIVITDPVSIY